jgi:dissimilatory sulfite reductase (desulfoviridin) alpha/beta subunit
MLFFSYGSGITLHCIIKEKTTMAFDFASFFGLKQAGPKEPKVLTVLTHKCPQNHRCPAVGVCPSGALTQKGVAAPKVDKRKCTDCGKCTRYCFPGALKMKRKEGV